MYEKLSAVFQKSPCGYIGYVEELPGANTQGKTLRETKKNLKEAIELIIETNRVLTQSALKGSKYLREKIAVSA